VNTVEMSADEAAEMIVTYLKDKGFLAGYEA